MELYDRKIWYETNPSDKWISNCPFCKNTEREHTPYVVWRGKFWFIAHNKFPILGLKNQFLAIPYRHVLLSKDLSRDEYLEFRDVEEFMSQQYDSNENYFMFVREWIESRSLEHIHYHFVPGRIPYDDIEIMLKKQGF